MVVSQVFYAQETSPCCLMEIRGNIIHWPITWHTQVTLEHWTDLDHGVRVHIWKISHITSLVPFRNSRENRKLIKTSPFFSELGGINLSVYDSLLTGFLHGFSSRTKLVNYITTELIIFIPGHCLFQTLGDFCTWPYVFLPDVQQTCLQMYLVILVGDAGKHHTFVLLFS